MLNDIHQQFIDVVKTGRGQRLKETPEMFSGLMWTGLQSVQLGWPMKSAALTRWPAMSSRLKKSLIIRSKTILPSALPSALGAGAVNGFWKGFFETQMGTSLR
jgi:protease-4